MPPFGIKLAGTRERPLVLDTLRRKWVALTPEEWVRQHFVNYLSARLGYPAGVLANEVGLTVGGKRLRADTVVYAAGRQPLMVVEYKAPGVGVGAATLEQASAYGRQLGVEYLAATNGRQLFCCKLDTETGRYSPIPLLPSYGELRRGAVHNP